MVSTDVQVCLRDSVVAARDYSSDSEATFVLLHGAGQNLETWGVLAEDLNKGARVVAIDLPGHGLTRGHPVIDYEVCSTALDSCLQALQVAGLPIVIGHSWGARIAAYYASTRQVRGVVLLDGMIGLCDPSYSHEQLADLRRDADVRPPGGITWSLDDEAFRDEQKELRSLSDDPVAKILRMMRQRQVVLRVDGRFHVRPTVPEYIDIQEGFFGPGAVSPESVYSRLHVPVLGIFSSIQPAAYYPNAAQVVEHWDKHLGERLSSTSIRFVDTPGNMQYLCPESVAEEITAADWTGRDVTAD